MKRITRLMIAVVGVWALLSVPSHATDSIAVAPRLMFYGRISALDPGAKTLTVHNKKRKIDATFQWNDTTGIVLNKSAMPPSLLKIGQSLSVTYVVENNVNKAMKIVVKKTPAPSSKAG